MKVVDMKIKGIKCDNPICDYRDDSAEYKDYEKWLNKPCPKCGTNLLTEKDLNTTKNLILITDIINRFLEKSDDTPKIVVHAEMNGTGEVRFKVRD